MSVIPVLGVGVTPSAEVAPLGPPPTKPAAASTPVASPVSGALPRDLSAPLSPHASCDKPSCDVGGLFPKGAADGAAPAAVWTQDIGKIDGVVTMPRHAGVDLYGVVLRGAVRLEATPGKRGDALGVWKAFRVPGAGVAVVAVEAQSRVLLAVVTGGEPVADAAARLARDGASVSWKQRPAAVEVADLAAAADLAWAGGAMHARTAFAGDGQRASLGVLIASADATVAQHQHDGSWEVLAALRASGMAKRAAGPGATDLAAIPVEDGAVVAMPKATQHAWMPGGKKPLVAVQLYVPPGPEQRFKQLAGAK